MNYRTRPAENVYSLEELFIKYLGLDIPIVPQTSSYSNKHTFSQLFFTRNSNQSDDIDVILSYSVFKESSIDELKKVASSPKLPLYYLIHPNESLSYRTEAWIVFF